ncbi:hypothetical protein FD46_GL001534 [Liquorilactobacillus oeni DSM 19972]|uniref:Uncharacterized protein n=1 Tax=Liquorilactobacillus oeni DSM 19972 TaxID=1423777 RepID=A0A0R1M8M1_9LACO|nr:hypothetical protein [Liquorilactobacillus oeni]KRL04406.1 hypothetical protein FD46_GL001534 [Liquorilactobacillus oeni DSM 19972]
MIAETHKELKLSRNTIYNWIYRDMIPRVSEDNLRYQKRFKCRKSTRLLEMNAKKRQTEELKIQERRVK